MYTYVSYEIDHCTALRLCSTSKRSLHMHALAMLLLQHKYLSQATNEPPPPPPHHPLATPSPYPARPCGGHSECDLHPLLAVLVSRFIDASQHIAHQECFPGQQGMLPTHISLTSIATAPHVPPSTTSRPPKTITAQASTSQDDCQPFLLPGPWLQYTQNPPAWHAADSGTRVEHC